MLTQLISFSLLNLTFYSYHLLWQVHLSPTIKILAGKIVCVSRALRVLEGKVGHNNIPKSKLIIFSRAFFATMVNEIIYAGQMPTEGEPQYHLIKHRLTPDGRRYDRYSWLGASYMKEFHS